MPINLQDRQKQLEEELNRRIAGRGTEIPQELASTQATIEGGRQDAIDAYNKRTSGIISSIGGDPSAFTGAANAATQTQFGGLRGELAKSLAKTGFVEQRKRIQLVYDNALRRALQSGADMQSAQAFARQVQAQTQQQDFQASESQKERDFKNRADDIRARYSQLGLQQENDIYSQSLKNSYEQAVSRALFGLGGAVGTGYLLSKYGKTKSPADEQFPTPNIKVTVVPGVESTSDVNPGAQDITGQGTSDIG